MSLTERINQEYIAAMKSRDSVKSGALNFLRAQIKNVMIDKRVEQVSDEEVIAVIKKQVKQRQDSIAQFNTGNRPELAAKEEAEMQLLNSFLPAQMSQDALNAIIDESMKSLSATSIKDMGKVMKDVLAKTAGQADNQVVGQLVKARLSA